MNRKASLDRIFDEQLETLAVALRQSTIGYYRSAVHRFLRYLHTAYPKLHHASQLCRDPHIPGWLRSLAQETPPLTNRSRRACLMCVRRLLDDLISNGQPLAEGLILRNPTPGFSSPRWLSAQTSISGKRPPARSATLPNRQLTFQCPTAAPCHRNAHRRVPSFAD